MKRILALFTCFCIFFCFTACNKAPTETIIENTPAPTPTATPHVHSFKSATCLNAETCTICGLTQGEKAEHSYVAGECSFCNAYNPSYCPKLYFSGNMTEMTSKKDIRNITFEYKSKDQVVSGTAKIKVQGSSSLRYDKKNYTVNFYKDSAYTDKLGLDVGWGKQNSYCLKANWIDKTHSRNVVTAKLAGQLQQKYGLLKTAPNNGAIDGFPVEIYINGSFHGLYTMNIPKDAWMFNMDKNNPNHIVVSGEDWFSPVLFREVPKDLGSWTIEVGPENSETLKKIQRLVSFVLNSSDEEFKKDFDKYLNLDSTLNYYIMMNYGWMPDNTGKNMLLATYDGKVWYPSLYDLDTTWGANYKGTGLYSYKNNFLSLNNSLLWERLEKLYKKEIANRYFELRETILDPKNVMAEFNAFYNSIPKEILDRENAKWKNIPGYPLTQIENYLNVMVPKLDKKYGAWK